MTNTHRHKKKDKSKSHKYTRKYKKKTKHLSDKDNQEKQDKHQHPYFTSNLQENEVLDKELEIVGDNVDILSEKTKKQEVNSPLIKKMISIVEEFLRENNLICYGGTAINNILPMEDQFYDYTREIPDYDFFSKNALKDAKRLADIFLENGFSEIEAKSGVHEGTYKVFVNFIPIADITQLNSVLFNNILKNSMSVFGIKYAPPDYLRMSMYLELSRPRGDVSRWHKVARRLGLLNKSFPMKSMTPCLKMDFSKAMSCKTPPQCKKDDDVRKIILKELVGMGVVFFGGYASMMYSKYMDGNKKKKLHKTPFYDVIVPNAERDVMLLKSKLKYLGFKKIDVSKHANIGDVIPEHYEIRIDGKPVVYMYQSLACHNYNVLRYDNYNINIATIDTMLSMYLAFMYSNEEHLNNERIVCMANFMYDLHQKNRLNQKGIFKRYSLPCLGKQKTLMDIRREKSEKYEQLRTSRNVKEFEKFFLRYIPQEMKTTKATNTKKNKENKENKIKKEKNKKKQTHDKKRKTKAKMIHKKTIRKRKS